MVGFFIVCENAILIGSFPLCFLNGFLRVSTVGVRSYTGYISLRFTAAIRNFRPRSRPPHERRRCSVAVRTYLHTFNSVPFPDMEYFTSKGKPEITCFNYVLTQSFLKLVSRNVRCR